VLFGESDGVWVHSQREKRKSAEVRVAILSTGRKRIKKDRFHLVNMHCITAIGMNSEMWLEQVLREAHLCYDLEETKLLISGDIKPTVICLSILPQVHTYLGKIRMYNLQKHFNFRCQSSPDLTKTNLG